MIKLSSITKKFPGQNRHPILALNKVNFEVSKGEFVIIIGASGSGKSTLLFTIGGLQKPTIGDVYVGNTEVYNLSAAARAKLRRDHIGFVFQTFNLVPYLNCIDNVALPSILSGKARHLSVQRAKEILSNLGLKDRLTHRPAQLSVGERQRVAIARSLVNNPEIILADEPTGNVDPDLTDEVMQIFSQLNVDGLTIIMVTHDHQLAERGSRLIRLSNGTICDDQSVSCLEATS